MGTLVKDDRLDVDARAPVPEWSGQGDPRHAITLDDLLRMSSGLEWSEQPYPYLRDGVWDGERVLPEGWVQYSRTPSASSPEYGAGWWLDLKRPGVFYAIGVDGQVIAVVPDQDLTFVALSTDSNASLALSEGILDAFAGRR